MPFEIDHKANEIKSIGVAANIDLKITPKGTGSLDVDTSKIINVTDPTSDQDAATKKYVDTNFAGKSPTINNQTDATHSLLASDMGIDGILAVDASSHTLTIPANATTAISVGETIRIARDSAGGVIILCASGVTLNGVLDADTDVANPYDSVRLRKTATNSWVVNEDHGPVDTPGGLWAWGNNSKGELGLGDTVTRSKQTHVGSNTDWATINSSTQRDITASVKTDGTAWIWGKGNYGILARGNTYPTYYSNSSSPIQIGALVDWAKIFCSANTVHGIKSNGELWAWGRGNTGMLGNNTTINSNGSPVQIGTLTTWSTMSSGSDGTILAVRTDGTMWAWGNNSNGECGDGQKINRSSPVQVGAETTWVKAAGGRQRCFGLQSNGSLWSWGNGGGGSLGHNNTIKHSSPVQIGALTNWADISHGGLTALAIKTDGGLWAWGFSGDGQLGDNTTVTKSSPVQIGSDVDWSKVYSGYDFEFATKTNGSLWGWGKNNNQYQLGTEVSQNYSSPVQVGLFRSSWTKIAPGNSGTRGIKT